MPNAALHSTAASLCACLLLLAGCGSDTGENEGSVYAGAGAVGGMGLGGNIGNPDLNMGLTGGMGGSGGMVTPSGGTGGLAGMMAMTGGMGGGGGMMTMTGGMGGGGGMMTMTGGMGGMTGGSGGMMMATGGSSGDGMSVSGIPDEELATLRQVCVDEINMYRATESLGPIARASADRELCSDRGAQKDGDSGDAHSSAGMGNPCFVAGSGFRGFPGFGSQNTCPGYPVGGFGAATIADALKTCLKQMWDEGEPPQGTDACIAEYRAGDTACFLAHGHYINMKGSSSGVSCGFYKMMDGKYWMNQDFVQ